MTVFKIGNESKGLAFHVVGIGASAGGLAAFQEFFSGVSRCEPLGMAFVLVQHLSQEHKSNLPEIVRRSTSMKVFEVTSGMAIEPRCVYVVPPHRDLALCNGILELSVPENSRELHLPINYFFKSLAEDLQERAIGIVLSGTGSDGSLGVGAIKASGGLVMAQRPDTADFCSMPEHAIATGFVDYELSPSDMAAQLLSYAKSFVGQEVSAKVTLTQREQDFLAEIFVLVRLQTGHNFSQYKPATIIRRIERRMVTFISPIL